MTISLTLTGPKVERHHSQNNANKSGALRDVSDDQSCGKWGIKGKHWYQFKFISVLLCFIRNQNELKA